MSPDSKYFFEILKLIASILTPIVVIVFGIIITRKVEKLKTQVAKEREWQTRWGETFYKTFAELNTTVEDTLSAMHEFSELNKRGESNVLEKAKVQEKINNLLSAISQREFRVRTQLGFAPKTSKKVSETSSKLFNLIRDALKNGQGNLDEIHNALVELNKEAMVAHREILGL